MKLFSWLLLLLIIFFTFLTGYAYLSGKVRECGCFGDCIPLTAGESFCKDLVLLALIVFLFIFRDMIRPALSKGASIGVLVAQRPFFRPSAFGGYVLVHLPVVDCLPYKAGNNIPEKMLPPPGAIPDNFRSCPDGFAMRRTGRNWNSMPAIFRPILTTLIILSAGMTS